MWGDNDRQLEAVGDIGNKGRQNGKAGIPSNKGTQEGRPCETRPRESGHTVQDRRTCGETMRDKRRQDLGNPTQADNGRQWVIPSKHRHTKGKTMGDKRRQDLGKADAPSNTGTHVEKKRDKRRQDLGKAVTQHRHTCGAHMREDNGKQGGDKGGQDLRKADAPSNEGK